MQSTDTTEEAQDRLPARPDLSPKQIEFLSLYSANPFLSIKVICKQMGLRGNQVYLWKKQSPRFLAAMEVEQRRSQQVADMSRKKVMRGMLEAIDIAKDLRQPGGMISGWKEIGRMCGFYEPEKRELLVSVNSQKLLEEIKTLPKEKLLELASEHDTLEAEFEVIDDKA